jgi:hypothetical protein
LLIDAANVIGSRPTGWWRDRSGAARAFVERLRAAVASGRFEPGVVVVVEGAARAGADEAEAEGVRVVHAPGGGDDTLVELAATAAEPVTVVTADRALRARIQAVGGESVGPSWLWARLDQTAEGTEGG